MAYQHFLVVVVVVVRLPEAARHEDACDDSSIYGQRWYRQHRCCCRLRQRLHGRGGAQKIVHREIDAISMQFCCCADRPRRRSSSTFGQAGGWMAGHQCD
eukprot:scaffold8190_cov158-Skeletonema_marinoi.AAC.1